MLKSTKKDICIKILIYSRFSAYCIAVSHFSVQNLIIFIYARFAPFTVLLNVLWGNILHFHENILYFHENILNSHENQVEVITNEFTILLLSYTWLMF